MDITEIRREKLKLWFSKKRLPSSEKSYLSQLINGKAAFGEKAARRIEKDYGMEEKYLDQNEDLLSSDSQNYVVFSLYDIQASAGPGRTIKEYPQVLRQVSVLESWARQALGNCDFSNVKLITANGTSMEGTISNGDVLFVDVSVRHFDGDGIYVISRSEELHVKRLQRLHGMKLAIISDNKSNKTETLNAQEANEVVICGRVLAAWNLKRLWM